MTAVCILAAVLLLLFLLLQVRLGVRAEYRAEGLSAWVRLGAFRLQVFPWRQEKKAAKKPAARKKTQQPAAKPAPPLSQRLGRALDYARPCCPSPWRRRGSLPAGCAWTSWSWS